MHLNKAFIIGNLTRDPELKSLPSGMKVTNFSVATNRVWKDSDGSKKEATEFHNVIVYGKQAETSHMYLKKGSQVLVEGRIQTRSWKTSEGEKRYKTEIVGEVVQFGRRPDQKTTEDRDERVETSSEKQDTIEYPQEDINPDDIPF